MHKKYRGLVIELAAWILVDTIMVALLKGTGMSNADKIRLYNEAKRAGFTGFGFGNTILHVDLGPSRAWAYGNSTYGGVSVCSLGVRC